MAENMVTLWSKDKKRFRVKQRAAMQSQLLKTLIDEGFIDQSIPIYEVSSRVLQAVITYCEKHAELPPSDDAYTVRRHEELLKEWDFNFMTMAQENVEFIGSLFCAANYLEINGLLDLIATTVADMIRGKTPEEIRTIFGIKNDLTPCPQCAISRPPHQGSL